MRVKSFSTIGLGRVGRFFTEIFSELGLNIDYLIDKNPEKDFKNIKIIDKIPDKIESDLILISTNDEEIEGIINFMEENIDTKRDKIFLHFSGALYIKRNDTVSLHPMMSITENFDKKDIKEHFFTIQGDNPLMIKEIEYILKKITSNYRIINGNEKKYFHLSSVMINNFSTALVKASVKILKQTNLNEEEALKMLLPLFKDVYKNIERNNSIDRALTGPIVRKDKKTINLHSKILKNKEFFNEKAIYDLFVDYIVKNLKN